MHNSCIGVYERIGLILKLVQSLRAGGYGIDKVNTEYGPLATSD
jgi:hypothetical protein